MFTVRSALISLFAAAIFVSPSLAGDIYSVRTDPATKAQYFVFKSPRGNVRFSHELHQNRMSSESCLPCHKTKTPTKEHTMTRFDERVAHYFCRGCHREKGRGPTECHECHKDK